MIDWDFDRKKLTKREAQIVAALIASYWDTKISTYKIALTSMTGSTEPVIPREMLEKVADTVRLRLARELPDLSIRWTWQEHPQDLPPESG